MLDVLIFDLDETLYPRSTGLMEEINRRINLYMIEKMGMDPALVSRLRREYWQVYGTTSRGLQLLHQIDVDDYMAFVHDIPLNDYLSPDRELDAVLAGLPQRKIVFTNSTAQYARGVLTALGIDRHFAAIYDVFFMGHESKPAAESYRRLVDALGVPPPRCLMVDDTARNLRPARALGMTTVLVDPLPGAERDGADFVIGRIAEIGQVVSRVERGEQNAGIEAAQGV